MLWLDKILGRKLGVDAPNEVSLPIESEKTLSELNASIAEAELILSNLKFEIEHEKLGTQRVRDTANEQAESIVMKARAELEFIESQIKIKRAELDSIGAE